MQILENANTWQIISFKLFDSDVIITITFKSSFYGKYQCLSPRWHHQHLVSVHSDALNGIFPREINQTRFKTVPDRRHATYYKRQRRNALRNAIKYLYGSNFCRENYCLVSDKVTLKNLKYEVSCLDDSAGEECAFI